MLGVVYYLLTNGKALGIWGDYMGCTNGDTLDGNYVYVKVNGDYKGDLNLNRGGIGKYTDGYMTATGLCVPKECTLKDMEPMTPSFVR